MQQAGSALWDATEWPEWATGGSPAGEANELYASARQPKQLGRLRSHASPAVLILPQSSSPPPLPPLPLVKSVTSIRPAPWTLSMASVFLWKLSSQKLGLFLVSFGFIWGMMLLHFTIQQRASHESSAVLRQQILDLSKRYIKALAEENQSVMDGPYVGTMTAYGESSTAFLCSSNVNL